MVGDGTIEIGYDPLRDFAKIFQESNLYSPSPPPC